MLEHPPSVELAEQRRAARHRCSLAALIRLYLPASGQRFFAWVHDISASGVALDMRVHLDPEQALLCQMKGIGAEPCFEVAGRIVYVKLEDGLYRVGCKFDVPLAAERLASVLRKLSGA
jgi:hypothetical protein